MSMLRLLLGLLWLAASCMVAAQGAAAPPSAAASAPPAAITVVLDDSYPPYIFRDGDGNLQGILKDTWALWQARTGIEVKLQAMDWAAAQATMAAGRADVIDTIFKTEVRQHIFDFGQPYAQLDVALFFLHSVSGITDADAVQGFTVGVKDGDACIDLLRRHRVDSFKKYASYSAVVDAARAGELRVFCMDAPPAGYLLDQKGLASEFRHSPAIAIGAFHRAVRKGDFALLTTLESGFARITAGEYQQIDEKWRGAAIHTVGFGANRNYLLVGILLVILFAALLVLWNQMLRRKVRERTAEVSAMLNTEMIGIVKTVDRVLLWANPAFEAMSGYSQGQLVGASVRMHFPNEQAFVRLGEAAYPVMASGKVYRARAEFVRKDGRPIWVDVSGAMLNNASGESLWVFLDITDLVRAETVRDETANHLEKLANRVPGMLFQYLLRPDGSSCFPYASEAIREIYRVSPQQVQNDAAAVFAIVHPDDLDAVAASIGQSASSLMPWQHDYRVKFEDGTVRWLFGNSVPERLEDGSTLWHGSITDITKRCAADEKLRQLVRVVEQAPRRLVPDCFHQDKPSLSIENDGAGVGRVTKMDAFTSVTGTVQYILLQ